ncbi:MAG TPA: cytidine deaminase [Opitutaceae bacterium]|nr:cytidine deaminase [Opitutaceae bacterium]
MSLSPLQRRRLIAAARRAARHAYAPYSKFRVGAAVLTASGGIFTGCNVENASYGLSNCAERTAIFQAVAAGERRIVAVAVYTPTLQPTLPCGACRQVISEFGRRAVILCTCQSRVRIETTLDQLLPRAFGPGNLRSSSSTGLLV